MRAEGTTNDARRGDCRVGNELGLDKERCSPRASCSVLLPCVWAGAMGRAYGRGVHGERQPLHGVHGFLWLYPRRGEGHAEGRAGQGRRASGGCPEAYGRLEPSVRVHSGHAFDSRLCTPCAELYVYMHVCVCVPLARF